MALESIGFQFCLELAFGVLLALAFVPKAPVGALFYRLMGTTALLPLLIAFCGPLTVGTPWSEPALLAVFVAIAAYPVYSGPVRGRRWALGLGLGLVAIAVALVVGLDGSRLPAGALPRALATGTALAGGAVAGSVGVAMVLGHWYLTVPNLNVSHLARLNRVTVASMCAALALIVVSVSIYGSALTAERGTPLLGPWGLFHLGTRVAVGLLVPLVFAWMTASSLRFQNTRSATGILYASTVLVMIGAAFSISLQRSYGVPL